MDDNATSKGGTPPGTEPPTHEPRRAARRGLLLRAITGLLAIGAFAGGGAWLLHATIDPAAEAANGSLSAPLRNEALEPVRSWRDLRLARSAEPVADRSDLVVVDAAALLGDGDRASAPARVAALRLRPDGTPRLALASVHLAEADERHAYWRGEWAGGAPSIAGAPTGPASEPGSVRPVDGAERIAAVASAAAPVAAAASRRMWRTPSAAAPAWLLNEVVGQPGRWHVRYDHPAWQALLIGDSDALIDRLMASGLDGLVLEGARPANEAHAAPTGAANPMAALVLAVARYTRRQNKDFIILLRNAEELAAAPAIRATIDGLVRENALRGEDVLGRGPGAKGPRPELRLLTEARNDGLIVLVSERTPAVPEEAERMRLRLANLGFVASFEGEPAPGTAGLERNPPRASSP